MWGPRLSPPRAHAQRPGGSLADRCRGEALSGRGDLSCLPSVGCDVPVRVDFGTSPTARARFPGRSPGPVSAPAVCVGGEGGVHVPCTEVSPPPAGHSAGSDSSGALASWQTGPRPVSSWWRLSLSTLWHVVPPVLRPPLFLGGLGGRGGRAGGEVLGYYGRSPPTRKRAGLPFLPRPAPAAPRPLRLVCVGGVSSDPPSVQQEAGARLLATGVPSPPPSPGPPEDRGDDRAFTS